MPKTHYKVDRAVVRDATRREPAREKEEAAHHGFFQYLRYRLVPIDQIAHRDVWHPGRIESIRKAIERGKPLPPIRADLDRGKYHITDGIHRYNASLEAGFTHIPVLEYVAVDAPEMYVPPPREKPVLRPGAWVRLLDPPRYLGSPWAVVVDYLGHSLDRGAKRHRYELLGIEGRDAEIIGDWRDSQFEIPRKSPPKKIRDLIEDYQRTYLKTAGAKGVGDLPPGWYVKSDWHGPSRFISLHDERGREKGHVRMLQQQNCGGAWVINNSRAPQGWGPFLYDIAMEFAGSKGVMPDRGDVSPGARKVWEFYLKNRRGDVDRYPLWDDQGLRYWPEDCGMWTDHDESAEALDFRYVKPKKTLIPALKAKGLWQKGGAPMGPSTTTILAATRVADRWLREASIFEVPPKMLEEATDTTLRMWGEGLLRFVEDQEKKLARKVSFVEGVIRRLRESGQNSRMDLQDAAKDPTWWIEYEAPTDAPDFFRGSEDNFEWKTLFVKAATEEEKKTQGRDPEDTYFFVVYDFDDKYHWGINIPEREYGHLWSEGDVRREITGFVKKGLEWAEMARGILGDYERTAKELKALAKKNGAAKPVQGTKPYQMGDAAVDFSGWKYLAGRIDPKDAEAKLKAVLPPRQSIGVVMEYGSSPSDRVAQWNSREWILTVWSKPYTLSTYSMKSRPQDIKNSVRHEMQHFAQDALKVIFDLPEIGGLPPKAVRTPGHSAWGEPAGQQGRYAPHELRDIEFQTRLADAVEEFMGDLDNIPVEHWQNFIKKFTGATDPETPRNSRGMAVRGWYTNAWFEMMKREDHKRWKAAVGKFIDELDQRGVMSQIKRSDQWNPVVTPRHDAWGLSVMRYRNRRMGVLIPSRPPGVDWTKWQKERKTHERKHWPTIKREYEQFIDSLSEEQLVRHKQLVNEEGDLEYWITPRLQDWDGTEKLPPSREVDHPRMPKRHRY